MDADLCIAVVSETERRHWSPLLESRRRAGSKNRPRKPALDRI
jgi:hypothetical protein